MSSVSSIQSPHANNRRRVRAYGGLSPQFTTNNDVRRDLPLSSFILSFVMEIALYSWEYWINICSDRNLSDVKYTSDVIPQRIPKYASVPSRSSKQQRRYRRDVLHLQGCRKTGLIRSPTLFSQGATE